MGCVLIVFSKIFGDRCAEKSLSVVHLPNRCDENVG
jgi:hypothetical protein